MYYETILLAAGQGRRMGASRNKILLHLVGKPVITYSLTTFLKDPACKHIVLVAQPDEQKLLQDLGKRFASSACPITVVAGGSERQESVYNGLQAVNNKQAVVMVHDGARPFVTLAQLKALYRKVEESRTAILGVPVKDTIKKVVAGQVVETVPRETLWQVQTPQVFYADDLLTAHELARDESYLGTDEASLMERYSELPVNIVSGSYENIKLTTPDDMLIGEAIVNRHKK